MSPRGYWPGPHHAQRLMVSLNAFERNAHRINGTKPAAFGTYRCALTARATDSQKLSKSKEAELLLSQKRYGNRGFP